MTGSSLADRPGVGPWVAGTAPGEFTPFPAVEAAGSIVDRFREIAARFPQHAALSSPAGTWSYQELRDEVDRCAGGLAARCDPAQPRPIGLVAAHDGPLVVALLAIITAGHIAVMIDPAAPSGQSASALRGCGADLILHDDAHATLAAELSAETGAATAALGTIEGPPPPPLHRTVHDPVMLAFTSGTSGAPKGGIITHGVLLNLVRGATNTLGIGPDDRMPMLFPTSLAVAAYPLFLPLLNGGTLATLDVRSVGLAPVADFLESERISVAYLAPTVVRFLVDALAGREFPDLRLVALGGEVVDAEVVALANQLFAPDLLANGYGTTETGVITLYVIDPTDPPTGAVPAGYPVEDTELLVVDDDGNAVPPGQPGELAVVGPYLFAGYWAHPELNRQVLSDDPAGRPGWRLYRTGDFGHLDEHGALVVAGRLDTRVKVRGRFVVLGDVEAAINEIDGIAGSAVVARERSGITELVAYVVTADGVPVDPAALRSTMLASDESYRVPARWVQLDELPRLPNGKTDRRALPAPEVVVGVRSDRALPLEGPHAGHDEVRARLRSLWERLLPVGAVGVDEDFFHLGGDSLLAAQMLVTVEHELGVTVPMGELVHARTIRSLAEVIVRHRRSDAGGFDTTACLNAGDESTRPRLWFVHDLQGSAFRVRHLAEHLGADQPVWSFESPLLRGEPNPFTQLDTFVARYVVDLVESQPEGPYWLAGYSFGGICAYEMARQLIRDGREVAFVGVVDVGPGYRGPGWHARRSPQRPWFGIAKPPAPELPLADRVRFYRDLASTSPSGAARHLMVRTGLARHIDPLRFRGDLVRHGRIRPEWRLWYSWEQHWRLAAKAWERTRTYPGRVDLFWADDSASADATMGWDPLVGQVEIHRFPGDHEGILEERGAAALAVPLRRVLDSLVADARSEPSAR